MEKYLNIFRAEETFGCWEDLKYEWEPDARHAWGEDWRETDAHSDERFLAHSVDEIVNLPVLKAYHANGIDRRLYQLGSYIDRIEKFGQPRSDGFFCIRQTYHKVGGRGRSYASRLSLQNVTREARSAALTGLPTCEWDMRNSQPSIFLRSLGELLGPGDVAEEFPLLTKFCASPVDWR